MKKIILVISLMISLVLSSAEKTDFIREALAKNDGFASEGKGTTGGTQAVQKNIFKVTNKKEFVTALGNRKNTEPKILMIYGTIDFDTDDNGKSLKMEDYMAKGYDFQKYLETHASQSSASKSLKGDQEAKRGQSQKNQSKNITVHVPANTSIIGIENAKLKGVDLVIDSDNVIIRNIMFESPYDYFPSWDPKDGKEGNWNSQYDSISIKGGTHIWIDHCHFQDGSETVEKYFGRKYEHRDGLVDITNQSDYITLSYNIFENHNKAILIGSSDSKVADEGKLNVTLHHNYFHNLVQRAPRVRFGKVHVYNNYYQSDNKNSEYSYSYSLGVGKNSKIYAENNVADIEGRDYKDFVKVFGGKELTTVNNIFNGQKIDKFDESLTKVDWTPTLYQKIDATNEVKDKVLNNAGVFKNKM
ncbi:pectate lyase [Leptotrichia shahii]|uniref:pectate lyase family protein n=1 Tax=Leptotrichia shahii TaxID=157691 RepID=UPI0028D58824|nr:pectate lyase [Leptotrichia shahii]